MSPVDGWLEGARVLVSEQDDANRLQEKGAYGDRTDDGLALSLHEAAYLVEADRLRVEDADGQRIGPGELIALGSRHREGFEADHLVYRDYRSRGYVLRQGDPELDGWARGAQPPNQKPSTLLAPRSEAEEAAPEMLLGLLAEARGLGRGLLLGVVDEESDVTYYEAGFAHVTGDLEDPAPERADEARLTLLRDRALLEAGEGLRDAGYGHAVGELVFCSLAEAFHLARNGAEVRDPDGEPLALEDVTERARNVHALADEALGAYGWARDQGLVPKTGFKYGVQYRVYEGPTDEGHAPYLLQGLPTDAFLTFRDLARFIRLAHSVNKDPILWTPGGALMLRWTRP